MIKKINMFDCVLLKNGTEVTILEKHSDGWLYVEEEIPLTDDTFDYKDYLVIVDDVAKITYHVEN